MRPTSILTLLTALMLLAGACGGEEPEAAPDGVDAVVWLAPDADQATIDEVRTALDDLDTTHQYLDKGASLAAFQAAFADDPAVLGNVDPSALPTQFQVATDDADAVEAAVAGIDGVLEVTRPPGAAEIAARRAELDDAEALLSRPRAIVVWLLPGTAAEVRDEIIGALDNAGATAVEFVDEDGALEALRASGQLPADSGPVEPGQLPTFVQADDVPPALIEELRAAVGVLDVVDSAIDADSIAAERARLDQLEAELG